METFPKSRIKSILSWKTSEKLSFTDSYRRSFIYFLNFGNLVKNVKQNIKNNGDSGIYQKVQFWQFFILLQEGSNAQQKTYLYQRTLN